MRAQAIHGVCAPNARFTPLDWINLGKSGATHLKLMWPDHSRADAEAAQAAGLKVLVRAPGEGYVDSRAVAALIAEFGGVDAVVGIELGNEPAPIPQHPDWASCLWHSSWYLEQAIHVARPLVDAINASRKRKDTTAAPLLLVSPGWRGECLPPEEGTLLRGWDGGPADYVVPRDLAERLGTVYRACDRVAVHCYDAWTLATAAQKERLLRWRAWGWHNLMVTEMGIAGPLPDDEKVRRYVAFLELLSAMPEVEAAFTFILGGVGFDAPPASYHLSPQGWALFGQAVAALG